MLTAQIYHAHPHKGASEVLSLTYEDRFLRRKVLTCVSGTRLLVDLPKTTSLDHGGVLITNEQTEVAIEAAPEVLFALTGDLTRLAWHIGNRHTPCQIEAERLVIQPDKVIGKMLEQLGASVTKITEPFTPEGGAYGQGRTHGHDHGATHMDHSHGTGQQTGHEHEHHPGDGHAH